MRSNRNYKNMNKEVINLMKSLKPILKEKKGKVQINTEGEKYRYDLFIKRDGKGVPKYIEREFKLALKSLDLPSYKTQFKLDNYTFTILTDKFGKSIGISVDKFIIMD